MVLISLKTSTSNAGGGGGGGVEVGGGADPGFHKRGLKKFEKRGVRLLNFTQKSLEIPHENEIIWIQRGFEPLEPPLNPPLGVGGAFQVRKYMYVHHNGT